MKYDVVRIMPDGVLAAVHLPLPSFIEAQELRSTFARLYPENRYTVVEVGALPVYHGTTTGRFSTETPNQSQPPRDGLVQGEEKFISVKYSEEGS